MKIKIIPFKAEHLLAIIDENHPLINSNEVRQIAEYKEKSGYARTMISEMGQILACAGVLQANERMGMAWSYITQDSKKIPISLFKSIKNGLLEAREILKLKRIELNTLTKIDCLFAERLGFIHEGVLYNFGKNGETFQRYSLCR